MLRRLVHVALQDKPIVTFKLRNGKKYFVKTGKKDMAGEAEKVTYDSKTKFISVESNDFTGSFPVSAAKANKMKAAK